MDAELERMQKIADGCCGARLKRLGTKEGCEQRMGEEELLLLALILILTMDGGDRLLVMLLLYIFA